MEHVLKIAPIHFAAVADGLKHAELRIKDRDYGVGDKITLSEWRFGAGYSGETVDVVITHVTDVSFAAPGYVMLSFDLLRNYEGEAQQGA